MTQTNELSSLTAQCASCKHIKRGTLSSHGFHQCALEPVWSHYPPHHKCERYTQAPQDALDKRAAWLASVGHVLLLASDVKG